MKLLIFKVLMQHFLIEKTGKVYKKGCVMLYVALDLSSFHQLIDEDDLTGDGIEDEAHITVLYGLDSDVSIDKVKKALEGIDFGTVSAYKVSAFENDKEDVVKFDIDCSGLRMANRWLRALPHSNKFKNYEPHLTIAYVKPGKGKKYVEKFKEEALEVKPLFLVYSPGGDKDKVIISIGKD